MVIAHEILLAAFHLPAGAAGFREPGAGQPDRRHEHRAARRPVRWLAALGDEVMLRPRPMA